MTYSPTCPDFVAVLEGNFLPPPKKKNDPGNSLWPIWDGSATLSKVVGDLHRGLFFAFTPKMHSEKLTKKNNWKIHHVIFLWECLRCAMKISQSILYVLTRHYNSLPMSATKHDPTCFFQVRTTCWQLGWQQIDYRVGLPDEQCFY